MRFSKLKKQLFIDTKDTEVENANKLWGNHVYNTISKLGKQEALQKQHGMRTYAKLHLIF